MNGLIKWFVHNPIAANLLMLAMIIGGVLSYGVVKKEAFPTHERNVVNIGMSYPGAASREVEQQIVVRIEEAISDLPGIFQITSQSYQGYGNVSVLGMEGYDIRELLNDIKGRVDAINTFPVSAERPIIRQQVFRRFLLWMAIYGDVEKRVLKNLAYQIRDEMAVLEGISAVRIVGLKQDEVAIEVSEENLRRYNLSFNEVAAAIRQSSLSVPAGTIKSSEGDIQIQARAQAFVLSDFENIVIRSNRDGSRLMLSDIAEINDGFSEEYVDFTMNGKPGLNLEVKMSDDPLLFEGTENARKYVEDMQGYLPEGVTFKINFEAKSIFDSRFNMLKDNAISGLILVFIILMLFLRPLLAFWVVVGIATTFAGAIWLLPYLGVSINMLSMFAFIMVLGIVVDDAIIVGESIYRHQQRGEEGKLAAWSGTQTVLSPVFLAVVSTILFFLPLMDVPSEIVIYTRSIFFVVVLCLFFSLVESMFILPSHLSHIKPEKEQKNILSEKLAQVRNWFSGKLEHLAVNIYQPALKKFLERKGSTFLAFTFIFAIAVTVVASGWIKASFFPQIRQPMVMINVGMPDGYSFEKTAQVAHYIRSKVEELEVDKDLLGQNDGQPYIREVNKSINGSSVTVFVGLTEDENRTVPTETVANRLRDLIGPLPEAKRYSLSAEMGGGGPEITLNLNMLENRRDIQQAAVDKITNALEAYSGVFNVRNDLDSERMEVEIELKPNAEALGISVADVARQVRQGFYGEEIQRIPRAKEDVRVMLRYTANERHSLDTLEHIRIRTNDGRELPAAAVAEFKLIPGPSTIRRVDRRRNISITAEVKEGSDANEIVSELLDVNLATWKAEYTGFSLSRDANLRSQQEFGDNFLENFIKSLVLVLAILAVAYRSLAQPFFVLLAIPFGFVGAVIGHLLWQVPISLFSFFGFLACAGVVVNDNLVLLARIRQLVERGEDTLSAVLKAGVDRFRPIILTSLTTFVGLMPILFERSLQSKFLKPMVISLSFGVAFSTVVTLILVPCCYYGWHRVKVRIRTWWGTRLGRAGSSRPVVRGSIDP